MPTSTIIRHGTVEAAVTLIKTSTTPKEAKWEARRVLETGEPLPLVETAEQTAREQAVAAMGGTREDLPMGELEPPADPTVDRTAAIRGRQAGDPHPIVPQSREQAIARDSAMARSMPPATKTQRGVTVDEQFVDLTEQLAAIDVRAKIDGMEIIGAIAARVPRERIRDSYWVAPQTDAAIGVLRLLHHGLVVTGQGLAVRWTKRTNQAIGVIVPDRRGEALLLLELEFAEAMVPVPAKAKVDGEISEREAIAVALFIESLKARRSDLDAIVDERQAMQRELLEAARAGKTWVTPKREDPFDAELAEILAVAAPA